MKPWFLLGFLRVGRSSEAPLSIVRAFCCVSGFRGSPRGLRAHTEITLEIKTSRASKQGHTAATAAAATAPACKQQKQKRKSKTK
jgi:hypothetical protein